MSTARRIVVETSRFHQLTSILAKKKRKVARTPDLVNRGVLSILVRLHLLVRVFLVLPLILSGMGCYVTREPSIVGVYKAEAPCVTITLLVKKDHSFVQSLRTASGDTRQLTGRWSIHEWSQGDKTVDFDPFLDFINDERGGDASGGTGFRPERWPRGILMGPIIVKCPESSYKIDYVK